MLYLGKNCLLVVKIFEGHKNRSYKQYKQWKKGETISIWAGRNIRPWLGWFSLFLYEICYMNIIKWKNIYLGGHYVWCFSSYLKKFIFNKVKTLTPNYNLKSWIILTCNQSFHENIFYLIVNIPHCPKITLSFIIKTNQSKRGFVNMVVSSFLKLRFSNIL